MDRASALFRYLVQRKRLNSALLKLCRLILRPNSDASELSEDEVLALTPRGLAPFILEYSKASLPALSTEARKRLLSDTSTYSRHTKLLLPQVTRLAEIIPEFDETFMLIKGFAADYTLHGGRRVRPTSDLDLLLNPNVSLAQVRERLRAAEFSIDQKVYWLRRLGAKCIWSTPVSNGEIGFDLHFSIRAHPSIVEPLGRIWNERQRVESLNIAIPSAQDTQMITCLHLFFDLLNGKFDPKTLLDLCASHRLQLTPTAWAHAGTYAISQLFDELIEEIQNAELSDGPKLRADSEPLLKGVRSAIEYESKSLLFPALRSTNLVSWLWWTSCLPFWLIAYPERAPWSKATASGSTSSQ